MDTWAQDNLGKIQLNPDPPHGINGQCVNSASSASMFQEGPELWGNGDTSTAWTIWNTFSHPLIQVIANTPTGMPEKGDLCFLAPNDPTVGTGPAGHVFTAFDNITTTGIRGLDTDWNGSPNLQYVNHTYNGLVGWFHIINKGGDMPLTSDQVKFLYNYGVGRPASDVDVAANVGKDPGTLINAIIAAPENLQYRDKLTYHFYKGYLQRDPSSDETTGAREYPILSFAQGVETSPEASDVTTYYNKGKSGGTSAYIPFTDPLYKKV